jgi:hypothetical protein
MLSLAALACNVQFGGSVQAPAGTPGSSVTFTGPANNSVIAEGSNVILVVSARDSGAGVVKVNFLVNGVAIGSQDAPGGQPAASLSAQVTWIARGVQGHLITAEAVRADGSSVGEAGVTIQVVPAPTAAAALTTATPTLTIPTLMPTSGAATTAAPALDLLTPSPALAATTPALPPSPTGTEPPMPTLRVIYEYLNIRAGPDAEKYDIIGKMNKGDTAKVIARNADRSWLVIEWGQVRGWVSSSPTLVEIIGDTTYIPLAVPQEALPPTATPGQAQPNAPLPGVTPTASNTADLVIEKWVMTPSSPAANQQFYLTIEIRNQGSVDAPASMLRGVFQPGNVPAEIAVPPIKAGASATLPPLYVTLPSSGSGQTGILSIDAANEVPEGASGEANNVMTITYDVK